MAVLRFNSIGWFGGERKNNSWFDGLNEIIICRKISCCGERFESSNDGGDNSWFYSTFSCLFHCSRVAVMVDAKFHLRKNLEEVVLPKTQSLHSTVRLLHCLILNVLITSNRPCSTHYTRKPVISLLLLSTVPTQRWRLLMKRTTKSAVFARWICLPSVQPQLLWTENGKLNKSLFSPYLWSEWMRCVQFTCLCLFDFIYHWSDATITTQPGTVTPFKWARWDWGRWCTLLRNPNSWVMVKSVARAYLS